uniref:AN1-type zinc finger protein 4 isoform X3 n=1 Tax=Doryrhamphus excisus TaxID=161450 RepID=UPI0025AE1DD6|nr:AN1-type zinc finger protein 4 isoform X3 [Doryrhamphus excisus]
MTDRKEPPFFNNNRVGAFHYKLPLYDPMELFIETLTGTCFELRVLPFEAIISVKAKIQRLEGIPVTQQHLIWNNLELDDEHCLHDYGIAEGCTLKLVLAMRGGPINTKRVVTMEDPVKEVVEPMESTKDEGWEKSLANKQVTFVVYREGDQLNFFRVVDRGDGSLTPLSESLSGGSVYNICAEDGERCAAAKQSLENSITMNKMKLLKAKMEDMNLNKKPKKSGKAKPRPPPLHPCGGPSAPSSTRHHQRLLRAIPQMNQPRQSNGQLPPIVDQEPSLQSQVKPGSSSPHHSMMSSSYPARLHGVKEESLGKMPELLSKREARCITKMANQACRGDSELLSARPVDGNSGRRGMGLPPATPIGQGILCSRLSGPPQDDAARQMSSLHRSAASHTTNKCLAPGGGVLPPFVRIGTPTYHLPPVKAPTGTKKKSSKHCFHCGKKTGLATSYECRCGSNFCATHRYAETHDCSYDYRGAGRRFLQDTNPLISAPKLPKI